MECAGSRPATGWRRARQLETAAQAAARAFVRQQAVELFSGEAHAAGLVVQGAADAVHQGRLSRAVRADQAKALAVLDLEVDRFERDEAAEAFAETLYMQQRGHRFLLNRPTMPWGAMITNTTISTPATSTLTAEESSP
jgi:ABC-type sulfate transport system substrate-binding protein